MTEDKIKQLFSEFDEASELYQSFVCKLKEDLFEHPKINSCFESWEAYFLKSHGDIFKDLKKTELDYNAKDLFIRLSYFDLVLDSLFEFFEYYYNISITNKDYCINNETFNFSVSLIDVDKILFHSLKEKMKEKIKSCLDEQDFLNIKEDFLRGFYESIIPQKVRQKLGEFYTPRSLAELALKSLDIKDWKSSFLDVGCGSGIFLMVVIEQKIAKLREHLSDYDILVNVLRNVKGFEINPVAVKSAKLNYLFCISQLIKKTKIKRVEVPIFLTDSIRLSEEHSLKSTYSNLNKKYDYLIGNPPWISWGKLTKEQRSNWIKKYVDEYSLLKHSGSERNLGYTNDDISVPFIFVACNIYLKTEGFASFILKRNLMKSASGKLFRSLKIKNRNIRLFSIHDFNNLRPFGEGVGAETAIYSFQIDSLTTFPIKCYLWSLK